MSRYRLTVETESGPPVVGGRIWSHMLSARIVEVAPLLTDAEKAEKYEKALREIAAITKHGEPYRGYILAIIREAGVEITEEIRG